MGGGRFNNYVVGLFILAAAVIGSPGLAQSPPPASPPGGQVQAPAGCNSNSAEAAALASIVQATGDSLQRKRWQPLGGVIQFTLSSIPAIPDKAAFFVCYRWRTTPENAERFDETRPDRVDRNNDGTTWTVTATIPDALKGPPASKDVQSALPLVPLADVRIVVVNDGKLWALATTTIGITHPVAAIVLALATISILLVGLTLAARLRLTHPGIVKASWLLRIVSTPSGYASLSQLQILLWTLVVAASAVYVMALSGELISVTNGTLVLLGIAGAAGVAAKVQSESQLSSATPPATKLAPQWSDLIVNENARANGTVTTEIDVARFQMLLFTLITAAFVVMNVVTTYVIPEIPTGFLTLMGISNGVYLGAKVAQGS